MHKKSQVQNIYREFSRIFTVQHRKLFQDSNIPKSYLTQIRGVSWHKNKIKRIRRGYYSSNNFQDSNKIKITESKTMGYLPRVLFFNAFELGAESASQVISKEALRSTVSSRSPLTTLGTLEVPEDDSTCKSLLVELKVLPILKTCCGLGTDTLGSYINFCSFPANAFSFLNLREEKIELKVPMDSSSFPILSFDYQE
jgi:hypothetical protein